MTPQMTPYTPSLYQPDSAGRFRLYPRVTETPIPGAGYKVGELVWAEQELNLDGSSHPQDYGSYERVPLRGVGASEDETQLQVHLSPAMMQTALIPFASGGGDQGGPGPSETPPETPPEAPPEGDQTLLPSEPPGFFERKLGPVPYWALGLGGLAVIGGAGYLIWRA